MLASICIVLSLYMFVLITTWNDPCANAGLQLQIGGPFNHRRSLWG